MKHLLENALYPRIISLEDLPLGHEIEKRFKNSILRFMDFIDGATEDGIYIPKKHSGEAILLTQGNDSDVFVLKSDTLHPTYGNSDDVRILKIYPNTKSETREDRRFTTKRKVIEIYHQIMMEASQVKLNMESVFVSIDREQYVLDYEIIPSYETEISSELIIVRNRIISIIQEFIPGDMLFYHKFDVQQYQEKPKLSNKQNFGVYDESENEVTEIHLNLQAYQIIQSFLKNLNSKLNILLGTQGINITMENVKAKIDSKENIFTLVITDLAQRIDQVRYRNDKLD